LGLTGQVFLMARLLFLKLLCKQWVEKIVVGGATSTADQVSWATPVVTEL